MIASSTLTGLGCSKRIKDRIKVCDEIINFCDSVMIDLNYTITPIKQIVKKSSISFFDEGNIEEKNRIDTILTRQENEEISKFLFSLGKTDLKSQIKLIESFKSRMIITKQKYKNQLDSKSKIYTSLGVCFGLVLALILI